MRKLIFFAAATAALFTGCLSSSNESISPYAPIQPGLYIHDGAWRQTNLTLDPIGVALRLEMLLSQAEFEGKDLNEVEVTIDKVAYKLKGDLLFGFGASIVNDGDGVYTVTYTGSEKGGVDNFYRKGSYVVDTHGVRLPEAVAEPWTVTLGDSGMQCWTVDSYGSRTEYALYSIGTVSIQPKDNVYEFVVDGFEASLLNYKNFSSDWDCNFKWQAAYTKSDEELKVDAKYDLRYALMNKAEFFLSGGGAGVTFSSYNGVDPAHMTYNVPVSSPLKWDTSTTKVYNMIMSGRETASLTSQADYNVADYPSPTVTVTRAWTDSRYTSVLVNYNGISIYL